MGSTDVSVVDYITKQPVFINGYLKSLSRYDCLKIVQRLENIEVSARTISSESDQNPSSLAQNMVQNADDTSFADVAGAEKEDPFEWVEFVEIDTTSHHTPYALPDEATVVYAIRRTFGEDEERRTRKPQRSNPGVWTIESTNLDKYRNISDLQLSASQIIGKVEVKKVKVTVREGGKVQRKVVHQGRGHNPNDLLITLLNADAYPLKTIPDETIHEKIVELGVGRIKRAVQQQNHRGTAEPCGNKFFVLENVTNADTIPRFFQFHDPKFGVLTMTLKHRLQQRKCSFCGDFHGAACPKEQQIRNLEKEREIARRSGQNTKIYSDSTMRKVNQQCLSSEVDAMSGGTIANILNAVQVDKNEDVSHVVLVSGANDMKRRCELDEYVYSVQSVKKRIMELLKDKSVSILLPPKQFLFCSEEHVKQDYLFETIDGLSNEGLTVIQNPIAEYIEDNGTHPSPGQTVDLCKVIDTAMQAKGGSPLILPSATDELMAGNHFYQKVNAIYKYGCAACERTKKNKWYYLCDECRVFLKSDENTIGETEQLQQRITLRDTTENPFLANNADNEDVDEGMPEDPLLSVGGKRDREENGLDDEAKRGRRTLQKAIPTKSASP